MVWVSVGLLVAVSFPRVIENVKRIRVKDVEIELEATVAEASSARVITLPYTDGHIFSRKGSFDDLFDLLTQAQRRPDTPVLLATNLRRDDNISIRMLFCYLYLINLIGSPVTVLFFATVRRDRERQLSEVHKEDIVGAVRGTTVLKVLRDRFPRLERAGLVAFDHYYGFEGVNDRNARQNLESIVIYLMSEMGEATDEPDGFLSRRNVASWFGADLSRRTIQTSLSDDDVRKLKDAIAQEDEFLIVFEGEELKSVTPTSLVTREISLRALRGGHN